MSWNQLSTYLIFSNFFSENVIFTKFLSKMCLRLKKISRFSSLSVNLTNFFLFENRRDNLPSIWRSFVYLISIVCFTFRQFHEKRTSLKCSPRRTSKDTVIWQKIENLNFQDPSTSKLAISKEEPIHRQEWLILFNQLFVI